MAQKLTWVQPLLNDDGSAFDTAQFAGFDIAIDGTMPNVSVPIAWNDAGTYELPLSGLGLGDGQHSWQIRTKAVNGQSSDFVVGPTFSTARTPLPPKNLAVVAA